MDLDDISVDEAAGEWMELRHPATDAVLEHDGKVMKIKLAGMDSSAYRAKERQQMNRRINKMSRGGKADAGTIETDAVERLAAVTIDWTLFIGGEYLKCGEEAARALYSSKPWIREQADAFVGDRANFYKQG